MDPDTVYDNPNNLVDLFEHSVTKFPDIRFLGTKNPESGKHEWLSRKQIAERLDNLRGALAKLGFTKGDKASIDTFELNETSQVISILPWAHVYGQNCDLLVPLFPLKWLRSPTRNCNHHNRRSRFHSSHVPSGRTVRHLLVSRACSALPIPEFPIPSFDLLSVYKQFLSMTSQNLPLRVNLRI